MAQKKLKTISLKELELFDFKRTDIKLNLINNIINYSGINVRGESKTPCVYLWLIEHRANNEFKVIYAGKAGKGVSRRHKQHADGYKRSMRTQKKSVRIKKLEDLLKSGLYVEVWYRESKPIKSMLNDYVYAYSVDEEALILKYKPLLNNEIPPACELNYQ